MTEPTNLQFALYVMISVEISLFFIMGGTDFGAGIATFFVKNDQERDEIVRTSGPVWGGNETWLVAGMAAVFGAFPHWYATLTSGFYLFFIFTLICFMFRGVAFDYRKKWRSKTYNRIWDWGLFLGNLIPPFLLGIVFSAILRGVSFKGNFIFLTFNDYFNTFTLVSGLLLVLLCIQIGLSRVLKLVSLETRKELIPWLRKVNLLTMVAALLEVLLLVNQTTVFERHFPQIAIILLVLVISLLGIAYNSRKKINFHLLFLLAVIASGAFMAIIFQGLYPNLIVNGLGENLTIMTAASRRESQLWVAFGSAMMLPLMLILQITAYHLINKYYDQTDSEINY